MTTDKDIYARFYLTSCWKIAWQKCRKLSYLQLIHHWESSGPSTTVNSGNRQTVSSCSLLLEWSKYNFKIVKLKYHSAWAITILNKEILSVLYCWITYVVLRHLLVLIAGLT
jgi:hypothetical protein